MCRTRQHHCSLVSSPITWLLGLGAVATLACSGPTRASVDEGPRAAVAGDDSDDGDDGSCTIERFEEPAPSGDSFEAFLTDAYDTLDDVPDVTMAWHSSELDAHCQRWLLAADVPQRILHLPSALPTGLECVAPDDAEIMTWVTDGVSLPDTWLLAGGEPFVVLQLATQPVFWAWDAARDCAVHWPVPLTGETGSRIEGSVGGDRESEEEAVRYQVAGGTLTRRVTTSHEGRDWEDDIGMGCTHGGFESSSSARVVWTYAPAGGAPALELASAADDSFHDDAWVECGSEATRPGDAMRVIYFERSGITRKLGVRDLETHLAACRASGSSRCTEKRFRHESPATECRVDAYFLDVHEVTQAQYARCVEAGACTAIDETACQIFDGEGWAAGRTLPAAWRGDALPQRCVTRAEAAAYCAWAGARLPTEAEWELAAGGQYPKRIFPWGDDWRANAAVFLVNEHEFGPEPVASHPAGNTEDGIHDLAGNVYEWVDGDACALDELPRDGSACRNGADKGVVRGGSFASDGGALRATYRRFVDPDARLDTNGFRCAMSEPAR